MIDVVLQVPLQGGSAMRVGSCAMRLRLLRQPFAHHACTLVIAQEVMHEPPFEIHVMIADPPCAAVRAVHRHW